MPSGQRDGGWGLPGRIAVLCDVDDVYADRTYKAFPKARRYRDFRRLLETEGDKIDVTTGI